MIQKKNLWVGKPKSKIVHTFPKSICNRFFFYKFLSNCPMYNYRHHHHYQNHHRHHCWHNQCCRHHYHHPIAITTTTLSSPLLSSKTLNSLKKRHKKDLTYTFFNQCARGICLKINLD